MPREDERQGYVSGLCNCSECRKDRHEKKENEQVTGKLFRTIGFLPMLVSRGYVFSFVEGSSNVSQFLQNYSERIEKMNKIIRKQFLQSGHTPGKLRNCAYCGRITVINPDRKITFKGTKYFCELCAQHLHTHCHKCDKEVTKWGSQLHGLSRHYGVNRFLCHTCYERNYREFGQCAVCSKLMIRTHAIEIRSRDRYSGHFLVCPACTSHIFTCNLCGDSGLLRNSHRIGENNMCNACWIENRPIHDYGYKPRTCLKMSENEDRERNIPTDRLFYGLELETEVADGGNVDKDNTASIINTDYFDKKFLYCKRDGSLQNGFEIVSHPFTWQHYRKNKEIWNNILSYLTKEGYSSYNSGRCGIHIHMTKRAFNTYHLYKFLNFIYKDRNRPFIKTISQRKGNFSYAALNLGDDLKQNAKHKTNSVGIRNTACNITAATVEVRLFRGTLNKRSFHKNFEFLESLFRFSNLSSAKDMEVEPYWLWVNNNQKTFKNLFDFCSDIFEVNKTLREQYNITLN